MSRLDAFESRNANQGALWGSPKIKEEKERMKTLFQFEV